MKMRVNKKDIVINNSDKIWFPDSGYTKLDIVQYYKDIAHVMVPHMRQRPVTMLRYPDGINGHSFYHKDMPDYFPDWIDSVTVEKQDGGETKYVVCDNAETLVYLASQACITPHIWLSKVPDLNFPDKLVFDLDPSTDHQFVLVKHVAKLLHKILESMKIESHVMTTGSRGLHVIVHISGREDFDAVRGHAKTIAQLVVDQMPDKVTLESRKEKREGRLLIDIMRNGFGQTSVAPYAVRARPHAPVATPLEWDDLDDPRLRSDLYTIKTVFKRFKS